MEKYSPPLFEAPFLTDRIAASFFGYNIFKVSRRILKKVVLGLNFSFKRGKEVSSPFSLRGKFMATIEEINAHLEKVENNLRQNRFKLEQLLITMQLQQQTLLDALQKIMEEQLTLQGLISGSLSQFEEKAGASQGLQGLFYGNPLLKNEIMQKRVALEQNLQKLREMSYQLQQKIQLLGKSIQDVGRYISPEIEQNERKVGELKESLREITGPNMLLKS